MDAKPFTLRPFQQRVFEKMVAGESVLLQAPTGAGKTRAALAPFLDNLAKCAADTSLMPRLPLTCRYAVPLRVLARQFFNEYETTGQKIDQHFATRLRTTYQTFEQEPIRVQTGEQQDDPQLEAALTFCTIDQLLASALAIPYGLSKRRANVNVGAVLGSYLVFDEFHLYPLTGKGNSAWGARTTTLALLQLLRQQQQRLTPFVLMTATFSSRLLHQLGNLLQATVISLSELTLPTSRDELAELNAGRERRFTVHDTPMSAAGIVEQHTDCSLVVCNTVLSAQRRFLELQAFTQQYCPETKVILLHSRYTDADRQDKQQALELALGKTQWNGTQYTGPNLIVVATQVVEVGLDISARVLHSESAPANSVIQRAGRCARFAGQHGHVHLYPIEPNDKGRIVYLPYDGPQCDATLDAFSRFSDQHVGFPEEQQVIDQVHGNEDQELLEQFRYDTPSIQKKIFEGWSAHERGIASTLIRDVSQVTILIHDDPNAALAEQPWIWQTFSLHPHSLGGRWQALLAAHAEAQGFANEQPIMAWQARLEESASTTVENERQPIRYRWEPMATSEQLPTALMVVLAPTVATYDPALGLVLNDDRLAYPWPATPFRSTPRQNQRQRVAANYTYEQESYAEHIRALFDAYHYSRLYQEMRYVAQRFEQALHVPVGALDQAIRLAIACHDIGKLGTGWQDWAKAWQALLVRTYPQQAARYTAFKYPFAHTDSEGREHRELEKTLAHRRPHHACESAALAALLIQQSLPDERLGRAVVAAIARHHSATSRQSAAIQLVPEAREGVAETLELVRQGQKWTYNLDDLDLVQSSDLELDKDWMTLPSGGNVAETLLYFLIVRVLRLADTRSFHYKQ
jgi:CRISPR-associated endonuclease/helicase Cas3